MSDYRYGDGKNSYRPNRYKAQLNHQRAMLAGESESRPRKIKDDDGDFISSRRLNGENPKQNRIYFNMDNFDDDDRTSYGKSENNKNRSNYPKRNGNQRKRNSRKRYEKKSIVNGRTVVLTVTILLILGIITYTVVQVMDSLKSNTEPDLSGNQVTASQTQNDSQSAQESTQEVTLSAVDATGFVTPNPDDNNESGTMDNGFYVWNDSIFELFYGDENTVKPYTEAMNRYAEELGSGIKTYTMIIPTHVEMGLPKRFTQGGEVDSTSQAENIGSVYKNLNSLVTPVNCYNELANHCNEYIYFRTDHHWTGLGAYYAYKSFAETTNQEVLSLDTCTKRSIDGFTGTLLGDISGNVPADTVEYWEFPYETTNYVYYDGDSNPTELSVYYEGAEGGTLTYGVFIWGDQSLEVLRSDRNTGKKIAIVKESFGNALAPYFTYNYDEVHIIDFRYWSGNLKTYCEENGIKEVLFANGVMSANTTSQIEAMDTLF